MERDICFDIMKGIGILAVIAGHSIKQVTCDDILTWKFIYSFHLPMFFLIAGYFYKENSNILNKIKADFKRLIIPYITTSFMFLIYQFLTNESFYSSYKYILIAILWGTGGSHTSAIWPNMPHIGAIWFLLSLFWCRTLFNLIVIKLKKPYWVVVIVAILATITDRYIINLPFGLLPGLSAMTFYLIGHCFHYIKFKQYVITISALSWIIHMLFSQIDMCSCYYKCYPIDILGTTFGAIIIYIISNKIASLSYSSYLTRLGKVSLVVLCFHTLEKNIIDYNFIPVIENNWIILFIFRTTICISLTSIWYLFINLIKQLSSTIYKI